MTTKEKNHVDPSMLTKAMRWQVADWMAEDRLPEIDDMLEDVHPSQNLYSKYIKRMIDIVASSVALLITFPINFFIGMVTYFDVGKPIFFVHKRIGKNGVPFNIVKFRNMSDAHDERGELLPPSERVTKWGKFVRKTSLDELLNFWSVFKGDMSLIGPRPMPPEYVGRYNKRHKMRLSLRPGLECPPHNGTDHIFTWHEQFENDIWYVEHLSFCTDCMMAFRMIQFVFNRKNAVTRGNAKRGTFTGYDWDGKALKLEQVPQEYIDRAYAEVPKDKKVSNLDHWTWEG